MFAVLLQTYWLTSLAQTIVCADTIINDGYFYRLKIKYPKNIYSEESGVFARPYFVNKNTAVEQSVNEIYMFNKYAFKDTVKFLSFTPKLTKYLKRQFNSKDCIGLYSEGLNLDSLIRPYIYAKLKAQKTDEGIEIGFCYVKIRWLHLRMPDRLAFDYCNLPYTLTDPFAKSKLYDIYIPVKLLQINNKVTIKKGKIEVTGNQ